MNNQLVKNIIKRFICWILLLQMINISIDAPDVRQLKNEPSVGEELYINDIETISELISEDIFEKDVPESDENDIDTNSPTIDLYCFTATYSEPPVFKQVEHYTCYHNNFSFESSGPNSPPPKHA